jgi:hypothetical protein
VRKEFHITPFFRFHIALSLPRENPKGSLRVQKLPEIHSKILMVNCFFLQSQEISWHDPCDLGMGICIFFSLKLGDTMKGEENLGDIP